jgi:hypothetical protein
MVALKENEEVALLPSPVFAYLYVEVMPMRTELTTGGEARTNANTATTAPLRVIGVALCAWVGINLARNNKEREA